VTFDGREYASGRTRASLTDLFFVMCDIGPAW
jgi:hypothetical protein